MSPELDEDISLKYPEQEKVIINKEIKIMEFINKKVQISYNLN
tara:strand:- start:2214 stop:2342 length:129 start_codon:yes stop_codon:yes gene_type:complete